MLLENYPYPKDLRVQPEAEALVRAGYEVEVIAPRAPGEARRENVGGVSVRRFRVFEARGGGVPGLLLEYVVASLALHAAALRALMRGTDVLHIHNPPDILFAAGAVFRLAGRRVVFDQHDLGPELAAVKFGRRSLVSLARSAERLTFAVASHVLAANESHAEVARTRGGKRPEAVTVVRNGPPAAWLEIPVQTRSGSLSSPRLVYLGLLGPQDGPEGLAAVLAHLRSVAPDLDAHLTVIGDGESRADLERELDCLGVRDRVTFSGWVAKHEVPHLLADADVCLDPSPATELNDRSTMVKVAEYMALGKPVVAYDLRETRRTVAGAALLVTPGDVGAFAAAVAQVAANGELRQTLGARARERARELTWERSATAMLDAYTGRLNGGLSAAVAA